MSASSTPEYRESKAALKRDPNAYWPTVKLADVFFALGDTANEKRYRERMYGRLHEE